MILGGSTNAVLHLIAMAHSVGIKLELSDFQNVSDRVPFIADLKPSGKYVMEDVYRIGGIPSKYLCDLETSVEFSRAAEILAYLLKKNLIDGNNMTVTGRTLGENLERWTHEHGELSSDQDVIRPLERPIKETGHIRLVPDKLFSRTLC
jgi:dihydroxy-acid dehydratase